MSVSPVLTMMTDCFIWALGSNLRSSCLYCKHFIEWTLFLDLRICYMNLGAPTFAHTFLQLFCVSDELFLLLIYSGILYIFWCGCCSSKHLCRLGWKHWLKWSKEFTSSYTFQFIINGTHGTQVRSLKQKQWRNATYWRVFNSSGPLPGDVQLTVGWVLLHQSAIKKMHRRYAHWPIW